MNVQRALEQHFHPVVPTKDGEEIRINCPFCTDTDIKQHMYINAHKLVVHCVKCDWAGSVYYLLQRSVSNEAAVRFWSAAQERRTYASEYEDAIKRLNRKAHAEEVSPIIESMPSWYTPFVNYNTKPVLYARMVLRYALGRLSFEAIERYGVGYCNDTNRPEAMRLILPVERGYYQARAIGNDKQKYLNPEFEIEDRLFNGGILLKSRTIYICEGIISAIALGNAVATLNKTGTKAQRNRLARIKPTKTYIFSYDAGTLDSDASYDFIDYLRSYGHKVVAREYKTGDPDSNTGWTDHYSERHTIYLPENYRHRVNKKVATSLRSKFKTRSKKIFF